MASSAELTSVISMTVLFWLNYCLVLVPDSAVTPDWTLLKSALISQVGKGSEIFYEGSMSLKLRCVTICLTRQVRLRAEEQTHDMADVAAPFKDFWGVGGGDEGWKIAARET